MDTTDFEADNTKNSTIKSVVPDVTKTEPCLLGIDEAGRGPVLGPMVYGTAFCPISEGELLKEMGLADSKTLTEEQREDLFEKIDKAQDKVGFIVEVLSPTMISNSMLRRCKYNLNELSHDTAIGMIKKVLASGVNLKEVYVDTVGDPNKYQAKLKDIFPELDITVAKKADSTYPIVSGASICAKVCRDRITKNWKFPEGIQLDDANYGSGYPSDPATKKFMANSIDPVFGFPGFVRFSWSTASIILDDKAVPVTWDDDDEDEATDKSTPAISCYFQPKLDKSHMKKHSFFNDRCLKAVTKF